MLTEYARHDVKKLLDEGAFEGFGVPEGKVRRVEEWGTEPLVVIEWISEFQVLVGVAQERHVP